MTALLLGATGRTGRRISKRLRDAGYAFRAVYRQPEETPSFKALGAHAAVCDPFGDFSSVFARAGVVIYAAGPAKTEGAEKERQLDHDGSRRQPISPRRRAGHHQRHWSLCTQSGRPAVSLLTHEARRGRLRHRQRDRLCDPPPREAPNDVGAGTIQLAVKRSATAPPVSREDVAAVTAHALAAGICHRVIGIVGGSVPIEEALRSG